MFAPIVLLLVVVLYRVVLSLHPSTELGWIHNFSPLTAVALCGAAYLPRRAVAAALPLLILLASDLVLNLFVYHAPLLSWDILPRYAALALVVGLGFALRGNVRLASLLGASFVSSLLFYAITNTGSWLSEPAYAKSLSGWFQALTVGLPGYAPTFSFYRQTLLSDLLFTALFAGCMALSRRPAPSLVSAPAR
jgi:hypothetical protein